MTEFAEELARCGGLPARILETHTDDGTGHCCRCTVAGQGGHYVHPCNLRLVATEALVIQGREQMETGTAGMLRRREKGHGPARPDRGELR